MCRNNSACAVALRKGEKMKTTTYGGWKNRQTWDIALWINNDESLYRCAINFMRKQKNTSEAGLYRRFIAEMGLEHSYTPDRVKWVSNKLSFDELDDMMRELIE